MTRTGFRFTARLLGYETNYTFGLNWYWTSFFRLQANYIRANVSGGGNGANNRSTKADIIALRAHQEF